MHLRVGVQVQLIGKAVTRKEVLLTRKERELLLFIMCSGGNRLSNLGTVCTTFHASYFVTVKRQD